MAGGSLVISTCAVVALAVTGTGCMSGECGEGTVRYGNKCVVVDPFDKTPPEISIDPPLHTRQVGIVRLTTDEPATIFYTIDGSAPTTESPHESDQVLIADVPDTAQLRYFAIDLAGNRSAEGSRLWIIDREGPGTPLDFKLVLAGSTRTVTWTPPQDPRFGGVLVARVDGTLTTPPAGGKEYAVGDTLGAGVTVVQVQAATAPGTFSESLPPRPGIVRYVAWAFDDLHNYGAPAGDYVLVPVPAQTGRVTVDAGTGQVVATMVPSHVTISGNATLVGSTLTVKLSVRNNTSRVLFGPKLLLTNTPAGVTLGNSDGTFSTFAYRSYGGAIQPGASILRPWTFTGASAGTMLTMDLDLRDGHVMTASTRDDLSGGRIIDLATGAIVQVLATPPTGPRGRSTTQRGGITPDGRMLVGARNAGAVSSYDLATGKRILTATLRPQKAHVAQVILDRSGSTAYALVAESHPRSLNNGSTDSSTTTLVRLDAASLTESGRLALDFSRNNDANLSSDGKTLIIATGVTAKGVIVVDLPTFTIKTRILPGFRPQCAVFSPDGASIVVVGEQIAIYKASDFSRTQLIAVPAGGGTGKVVRAVFSDPNTLWIGRRTESAFVDLASGMSTVFTMLPGRMLDVFDGKIYAGSGDIKRIDRTGAVETTIAIPNLRGHWLGRSPF